MAGRATTAAVSILLVACEPARSGDDGARSVPIGGGYLEASIEGFVEVVVEHAATPGVIDVVVVPATYGIDPDARADNLELAGERTQQIEDGCVAVAEAVGDGASCRAVLAPILTRADAEEPGNVELLARPEVDGLFMLGGDQTIAMEVLAGTRSEEAMADAYERGVVFGGSSAGAAVQSQTMLSGYTEGGGPGNALERDRVVIWWSDDGAGGVAGEAPHTRGLSFAGERFFTDQHYYQRGRVGRSLNTVAQSDGHFGGESLIGLGFDYGTGAEIVDGRYIEGVFGPSSMLVIDGESGGTAFEWVGVRETLTAENLVTHVLAADSALRYDVEERRAYLDGEALPVPQRAPGDALGVDADATLMLGGGLLDDPDGSVFQAFLADAGPGPILLVGVGYTDGGGAREAAEEYRGVLTGLGWTGPVEIVIDPVGGEVGSGGGSSAAGLGGAILFAEDQSRLPEAVESGLGGLVEGLMADAPVVLTDGAMTAAMGDRFVADPDPTEDNRQEEAIAAFRSDGVEIHPGLGVVEGFAFEPRLAVDQRWGRLYALARYSAEAGESLGAMGIGNRTALVIDGDQASVVGPRSVIVLDGRSATFSDGENGAFTALNVYLDLYAEGSVVP